MKKLGADKLKKKKSYYSVQNLIVFLSDFQFIFHIFWTHLTILRTQQWHKKISFTTIGTVSANTRPQESSIHVIFISSGKIKVIFQQTIFFPFHYQQVIKKWMSNWWRYYSTINKPGPFCVSLHIWSQWFP